MFKPAKSGQSVHTTSVIVYMFKVADRPKHDHDSDSRMDVETSVAAFYLNWVINGAINISTAD